MRLLEKPYFIVIDGENTVKRRHRHLEDAVKEMNANKANGIRAGILLIDEFFTRSVYPLRPITKHIEPLKFHIL